MNYRSDIGGLRAVAVSAVLLFHAGFAVPGGFLGVDAFFVISGYLITRSIVEERIATGRFDYRRFYIRRIRRLLPALLSVSIATLIVAYAIFPPDLFSQTGTSSIFSALSLSNVCPPSAPLRQMTGN